MELTGSWSFWWLVSGIHWPSPTHLQRVALGKDAPRWTRCVSTGSWKMFDPRGLGKGSPFHFDVTGGVPVNGFSVRVLCVVGRENQVRRVERRRTGKGDRFAQWEVEVATGCRLSWVPGLSKARNVPGPNMVPSWQRKT